MHRARRGGLSYYQYAVHGTSNENDNGIDNGNGRVLPVSPYDNNQNFGRISLIDSLYLYGKSNVQTRVFDRETIDQKEKKTMSFTVDKSNGCNASELTATLTWFDQSGQPGCQVSENPY